eukprot:CAMPEP_0114622772 /NCGR_PEP_ID=MMETSP0168-20121206/9907_1 /TAXON_ID=95228 ORGANISM="Vannella sp., Strain DIVA3 517/6/12" /NCGR_SAMPLE_ID=MMETSP0168 /ASSEMBLY_ACC=CAM_ASM_000044 /LENGTH=247 /DNA_ID=CAMNT_0001833993 /DNA_START=80 /DNA_END=821 /DNA_ORIENTATION=-
MAVRVQLKTAVLEKVYPKRDEEHTADVRHRRTAAVDVLEGGGDELLDGDEDHDASDGGEHTVNHVVREAVGEEEAHDDRAHRLACTGQRAPLDGLPLAAGGVVDGRGHSHALGNVVSGDGKGEGEAHVEAAQAPQVHRNTLGEVVDADAQRRHHAQRLQVLLVITLAAENHGLYVWFRHEQLYQVEEAHAQEEAEVGGDEADALDGAGQEVHEGDVGHDAGAEAEHVPQLRERRLSVGHNQQPPNAR